MSPYRFLVLLFPLLHCSCNSNLRATVLMQTAYLRRSMMFVTVSEFRESSAEIWRRLATEGDLVVTSRGKPVAILSSVSGDNFEEKVQKIRRARAENAVHSLQRVSVEAGNNRISDAEIEDEIALVRKERRR